MLILSILKRSHDGNIYCMYFNVIETENSGSVVEILD